MFKRQDFNKILSDYVYAPFEYVYIHGPKWLGMWEGLAPKDICTGLTMVTSDVWSVASTECKNLIRRHTHATVLGIGILVGLLGVSNCCNVLMMRALHRNLKTNAE